MDIGFEAIGDPCAITEAFWANRMCGRIFVSGITPKEETTNLHLHTTQFHQKSLLGQIYGMISTHLDIPRLTQMTMMQDLKLDKLDTHKFKFEDINDFAKKLHKRQIQGRWVLARE